MKKSYKIMLTLLLALCLAFGMIACGDDTAPSNDGKTTYTITVSCPDETALATISVKLVDVSGKDATEAKQVTVSSDRKSGTATFKVAPGTYTVSLSGLISAFDVPETVVTATAPSAKIELKKSGEGDTDKNVEYKIKFVLPDNKPVAGIGVQICGVGVGASCHPATTDSDGYATFNLPAQDYEVHVPEESWPEGYCFDDTEYVVTSSTREMTVSFKAITEYTVGVYYGKITTDVLSQNVVVVKDEQKPVSGMNIALSRFDETTGTTSVKETSTGTTGENGIATIKAPGGLYKPSVKNIPVGYIEYNSNALIGDTSNSADIILIELGGSKFASIPVRTEPVTVKVSPNKTAFWYDFNPGKKPGVYKIESKGSLDTFCERYAGTSGNISDIILNEDGDGTYKADIDGTDKNFYLEFEVMPDEIENVNHNNNYIFRIGVNPKSINAETSFTFQITWLKDVEQTKLETTSPKATQASKYTTVNSGTWTPLDDINKFTVVKGDDGYYHNGTKDGEIILVAVAPNSAKIYPQNMDADFITMHNENGLSLVVTDGKTYRKDYFEFMTAYAEAANEQGLHPLTDELKDFLTVGFNDMAFIMGCNPDNKNEMEKIYFFACGYFKK